MGAKDAELGAQRLYIGRGDEGERDGGLLSRRGAATPVELLGAVEALEGMIVKAAGFLGPGGGFLAVGCAGAGLGGAG